jgi:hypothetical protein
MSQKLQNKVYYLLCEFRKGCFSSERTIEFDAISGRPGTFDQLRKRGVVITDLAHITTLDLFPIGKDDQSGRGYVKCRLWQYEGPYASIGISDNSEHALSKFIVPRDNIEVFTFGSNQKL